MKSNVLLMDHNDMYGRINAFGQPIYNFKMMRYACTTEYFWMRSTAHVSMLRYSEVRHHTTCTLKTGGFNKNTFHKKEMVTFLGIQCCLLHQFLQTLCSDKCQGCC